MTPLCLGIFQIPLFGQEIWDNNCIFQDNIGLCKLKIFVLKKSNPLLSWNCSHLTIWRMVIWHKNCIFQDHIGLCKLKIFVSNEWLHFVFRVFKSNYLERRYGAKTTFFQDRIQLCLHEMFTSKNDPLLSWNFSNLTTWRGDMGQQLHFST